jgi:hypothetical protein
VDLRDERLSIASLVKVYLELDTLVRSEERHLRIFELMNRDDSVVILEEKGQAQWESTINIPTLL